MALEDYLKKQGFNCIRHESLFGKPEGIEIQNNYFKDYTPVFILREPIARLFSHYYYRKEVLKIIDCGFKEALDQYPFFLDSCNYPKWINHWENQMCVVLYLENLIKAEGFKKLNSNSAHYPDYDLIEYAKTKLKNVLKNNTAKEKAIQKQLAITYPVFNQLNFSEISIDKCSNSLNHPMG